MTKARSFFAFFVLATIAPLSFAAENQAKKVLLARTAALIGGLQWIH